MHAVHADTSDLTLTDIGPDGIHPTDAGYRKIAGAFLDAYKVALSNDWIQPPNPQASDVAAHPCGHTEGGLGGTNAASQVKDRRWEDHGVSFEAGFGKGNSYRWGDVNEDGKPELFVVKPDQSWTFYWNSGRTAVGWTGWAKGVSRPARQPGLVGNALRIADMDRDGEPDCVTVDLKGHLVIYVWDNTKSAGQKICGRKITTNSDVPGTGTIDPRTQIVLADVDGFGAADYLLVEPRGTTRLWLNSGLTNLKGGKGIKWQEVGQITGPLPSERIRRWADINGDGVADQILLTAHGGARAWLNKGLTFESAPAGVHAQPNGLKLVDIGEIAIDKNVPPRDVQFVDVGGDGRADFVRTGWTGVTHIWLNRLSPADLQ